MSRERSVHSVAWWLWSAGLAVGALRTSNPLILLLLAGVLCVVTLAAAERDAGPNPLRTFAQVAVIVIVVRVALQALFGERLPGHVIVTLPSVPMPSWAAGVSIGGPVTVEGLLSALTGGLRLAVVLLAFGAANALGSPRQVLRSLPGVLHEIAVAVTVALCFAPEVLASVRRVRQARLLRGRPTTGVAGMRGIAVPVLEDALERSVQLAASMGARGFGRRPMVTSRWRARLSIGLVVVGSLALLAGGYGILAGAGVIPGAAWLALAGLAIATIGVLGSGRRAVRTRYRPMPFGWRSTTCALAGWMCAGALGVAGMLDPAALAWSPWPLAWPTVTPLALAAVVVGLVPVVVATRLAREPAPSVLTGAST